MALTRTIDIDADTATLLEKKAGEAGLTPAELISSLVQADEAKSAASLLELRRRWTAIEDGEATIPHGEVERWLRSWGTTEFRAWAERE